MRKRDFSHRRKFPGTHTPGMNLAVRASDWIEALPAPVFALLLALIAIAGALGRWQAGLGLLVFVLGDWIMVALLPRCGRSYGPVQPQVLALAVLRAPFALLPLPLGLATQVVGTCLAWYAFWVEPFRMQVTRQALQSPKLGPGAPLRLLHFSDLHIERLTPRERRVVDLAAELHPDVIAITGDFLSLSRIHDAAAVHACRWVLERLAAPLGVLVVSGSPAVDETVMPVIVEGTPVRWLRDERVALVHGGRTVDVVGLSCTHKPFVDGPTLCDVLQDDATGKDGRPFTLLLYHTPDLAPDAAEAGVDLQLSGHTHGGQVRLPLYGAVVTASLYGKAFEMGRRQIGGLTLYVTRGLGMEGSGAPRVRFLCPPEVVLWELGG